MVIQFGKQKMILPNNDANVIVLEKKGTESRQSERINIGLSV
jgi:hypothetical protein